MKILDFGSGPQENVEILWTPGYGIEALQKSVAGEIGKLTVHAFDPLEIESQSSVQRKAGAIYYHKDFKTLPDDFDVICALHPNPVVIYSGYNEHDNWSFQHARYMGLLVYTLEEKLKPGGRVILQFDDELEKFGPGKGAEKFIRNIQDWSNCSLDTIHTDSEKRFPPGVYSFSSLHVLEKKNG